MFNLVWAKSPRARFGKILEFLKLFKNSIKFSQTRLVWIVVLALVWRGLVAIEMATAGAVSRNSSPRRSWCPAFARVKRQVRVELLRG